MFELKVFKGYRLPQHTVPEETLQKIRDTFSVKPVCHKCSYYTGKKEHGKYKCYTKNCPARNKT